MGEKERKRTERKAREKEEGYQERLRAWETREGKKAKEYENYIAKEKRKQEEQEREARKLKEFLEDYDDERDDSKFYRGRELQRRIADREKEASKDTEIVKESVIGNVIEKGTGSVKGKEKERGKENVSEKWREGEEKGAKARVRVEVLSDLTECVEAETEILGVRKRSTRKERWRRRRKRGRGQRGKQERKKKVTRNDQRDPRDRKDQKEIVTEKVLLEREVEVEKMVVIQEKGTETVETVITNLGIETEIVKESVIGNVIEKGTGSVKGKEKERGK